MIERGPTLSTAECPLESSELKYLMVVHLELRVCSAFPDPLYV